MKRHHQIYFLRRGDGLIKIGTTSSLEARLAALTASHGALEIIRVINGDRRRERALHRQFRSRHEYGEWFRDHDRQLTAEIHHLAEGDAIAVAQDDAKAEWMAGEAAFMATVRDAIEGLIDGRRQYRGQKREAAIAALTREYGFPKWLLSHAVSGRASTISAFAFDRIMAARQAELQQHLEQMRREIAAAGDQGEDLLALGREIDSLESNLRGRQERRAAKRAAMRGEATGTGP